MPIRGVLFDKDGTLVDFEAPGTALARRMALKAADGDAARADFLLDQGGLDLATGRFRADSIFAAGTNADVVELWHPHLKGEELADTVARFDAWTAVEASKSAVPLRGIAEALSTLHGRGMKLGVATNDSTVAARLTVEALSWAPLFSGVFGYDSVQNPKPAPDVVFAFARLAGLSPAEIAFVGDNRHDLECGRAAHAGLVVGVLSGTGTRAALAPLADALLDSVANLPAHLSAADTAKA
jgi:phosphoglycolate phosphatase